MKKINLTIMLIFFSLSLESFDIVNKLASPFYYGELEDNQLSYKETYEKANKVANIIFIVCGIFFVLLFPSRKYSRRHYNYYQANLEALNKIETIATALTETAVKIFASTQQKKYFQFTQEDISRKENEIKELLEKNGINLQNILKFASSSINEFFKYLSNKENKFKEISTYPLYKKFSDKTNLPILPGYNYEIKSINLVNFRYSIYEKAFSVYVKYQTVELKKEKGIFVTFIEENGFKMSLVERESESYVMKLESFFTYDSKFSLFDKNKLKEINPELKIAETFYEVYMWWKDNHILKKEMFINESLYKKLLETKSALKDQDIFLRVSKVKISNIEILNIKENFSELSLIIVARIIFEISGSFIKNNISLVDNEEKSSDEIWEFELRENKILIREIIKKDQNNSIQPNPLQIEWHI